MFMIYSQPLVIVAEHRKIHAVIPQKNLQIIFWKSSQLVSKTKVWLCMEVLDLTAVFLHSLYTQQSEP
jgi:hypothetical protein